MGSTGSRRRSTVGGLAVLTTVPIGAMTAAWFAFNLLVRSPSAKDTADRERGKIAAAGKDRPAGAGVAQAAPAANPAPAGPGHHADQNQVIAAQPTHPAGNIPVVAGQAGMAPDPRRREISRWGLAVDPGPDSQIHGDPTTLTITVPPNLHDLNARISTYNAPRVIRDVDGDFDAEVRVEGDFTPGSICSLAGAIPFVGGGIVICGGADNSIRLERMTVNDQGQFGPYAIFEQHTEGKGVLDHNGGLSSGTAYLRLARRGSIIRGFTSSDGRRWSELEPIRAVLPARLQVGLDAINSGNASFTVRFKQFSIKTRTSSAARR
jgi:hypothetical protein